MHSIAQSLRSDLLKEIQKSSFISVCLDESTDISQIENLVICLKYIKPETFEAKEVFFSIEELKGTSKYFSNQKQYYQVFLYEKKSLVWPPMGPKV